MGPENGECTCIRDIETRHHVEEYATLIVTEMTEAMGVGCEEMFSFGVEQVIIKLVHVLACMRHLDREIDDPKVYEEVRKILTKYDRQSAGLLNTIIQEYKARTNPNACH